MAEFFWSVIDHVQDVIMFVMSAAFISGRELCSVLLCFYFHFALFVDIVPDVSGLLDARICDSYKSLRIFAATFRAVVLVTVVFQPSVGLRLVQLMV